MSRRAGLYLSYFFLIAACVYGGGCNGCAGAPSNFNKVTLVATNPVILEGGTTVITAMVANDTSNSGVSWTLAGVGALSGPTKSTVTYTAPASVTTETTVTIKAAAVDFPSQTASILITLEPNLAITTASLSAGNEGSAYTATVAAVGGVPSFVWSVSSGSLPAGLSLGSSNTRSATISGTPTTQGTVNFTIEVVDSEGHSSFQPLSIAIGAPLPLAVTAITLPTGSVNVVYPAASLQATGGVPPFTWFLLSGSLPPGLSLDGNGAIVGTPTQAGTFTFNVQVNDSETPPMTATGSESITVSNLALLSGNYVFEFNGYNSSGDAVAVAGSFTADGKGNLTAGVEDVNTIGGSPKNQTFTGTYTMGTDNRGLLTFSSLPSTPAYSFALNSIGSHGRIIEFDGSGIRGSGDLEIRSLSTCTDTTFNGNYAFGLVGEQIAVSGVSTAGPDVIVGSFTATGAVSPSTQGAFGPGELDANTPVRVTIQDQTVGGSYQATSEATRCSMSLSSTLQTMNFSVYPISASQSFLVETDAVSSTAPLLVSGTIQQQLGYPFLGAAGSTFTGPSIAALSGREPTGNTYVPDVAIVSLTGTGTASFTMNAVENQAGDVLQYAPFQADFEEADQYGRVATNLVTPFGPVFYMINQNTAFCIGEDQSQTSQPYPFFGIFQPQSTGPFTSSSIAGNFVVGTTAPTEPPVEDLAGAVTLANTTSTSGTVAGLENQTTSQANTSNETASGGYVILNSNSGLGSMAFSSPATATGEFFIVSPTEMLMITTTTGDANPVIDLFEQ
jgi:Putative Ig domain